MGLKKIKDELDAIREEVSILTKLDHPNIVKYLPEQDEPHTEEQKFKAYLEYMGDDDKEEEPTGDQVTLLFRVGSQQGYDISKDLSRIRMESLTTQRETHKKLNEKNM